MAESQIAVSKARRDAAALSYNAAVLRYDYNLAALDMVKDSEINVELLDNFAELVKETATIYLRRATEVAFLMERAFEFENGIEVDRIRLDYSASELTEGLYAADMLIRDIDYFTYHRILSARSKDQPASKIISLAHEYPTQFINFRKTGKIDFKTYLDEFFYDHPGLYNGRIKNIEIILEGLVGSTGPVGTLVCGGISGYRRQSGDFVYKVHPPETLLITSYIPRRDALVADIPSHQLRIFENIGLETDWTLEFPKDRNNIDFGNITDIKFIISYLCSHNPSLEEKDISAKPAMLESKTWFSLRHDFVPDAFFLLSKTGEIEFQITGDMLPYNHQNLVIIGFSVIALGFLHQFIPLTIRIYSDEHGNEDDTYSTNSDNIIIVQKTPNSPISNLPNAIEPDIKPVPDLVSMNNMDLNDNPNGVTSKAIASISKPFTIGDLNLGQTEGSLIEIDQLQLSNTSNLGIANLEYEKFIEQKYGNNRINMLPRNIIRGFTGKTLFTTWHLKIDPNENPSLRSDDNNFVIDLSSIRDIMLVFRYAYTT